MMDGGACPPSGMVNERNGDVTPTTLNRLIGAVLRDRNTRASAEY